MMRFLVPIITLLGLLVAPSTVGAKPATMYCNFVTDSGRPYLNSEMTMYSTTKFSKTIKIDYVISGEKYEGPLTVEKPDPKKHHLFSFTIDKDLPSIAQALRVYDEVVDPNDEIERWPAIMYTISNRTEAVSGSCFVYY